MDHSQSLLSQQVDDTDELSTLASQLQITHTRHAYRRAGDVALSGTYVHAHARARNG